MIALECIIYSEKDKLELRVGSSVLAPLINQQMERRNTSSLGWSATVRVTVLLFAHSLMCWRRGQACVCWHPERSPLLIQLVTELLLAELVLRPGPRRTLE